MSSKQIAVNLLFTFVVCLSASLSFALLQQVQTLRQQVAAAETAAESRDAEARENINTTYKILGGMASRWRLTANMQVRSYHYIAKHEGTHIGCPECFDILRRNGEAIPVRTPDAQHAE